MATFSPDLLSTAEHTTPYDPLPMTSLIVYRLASPYSVKNCAQQEKLDVASQSQRALLPSNAPQIVKCTVHVLSVQPCARGVPLGQLRGFGQAEQGAKRTSFTSILDLLAGLACRGRGEHRQHSMGRRRLPLRPIAEDGTANRQITQSFPGTRMWSATKRRCPTADDLSPGAGARPQTQALAACQTVACRLSRQCRTSALSDVVMLGPSPAGGSRQRARSELRDSP